MQSINTSLSQLCGHHCHHVLTSSGQLSECRAILFFEQLSLEYFYFSISVPYKTMYTGVLVKRKKTDKDISICIPFCILVYYPLSSLSNCSLKNKHNGKHISHMLNLSKPLQLYKHDTTFSWHQNGRSIQLAHCCQTSKLLNIQDNNKAAYAVVWLLPSIQSIVQSEVKWLSASCYLYMMLRVLHQTHRPTAW